MGYFVAVLFGYVIGAKAGSKDLDQVVESLNALRKSEEFGDLLSAVRSHAGHALREVAAMLDSAGEPAGEVIEMGDLVERVRGVIGPN